MNKGDITLQHADCLVRKESFGVTEVHNICTNVMREVPWTFGDWIGAIALAGVMGILFVFIFGFAAVVWSSSR